MASPAFRRQWVVLLVLANPCGGSAGACAPFPSSAQVPRPWEFVRDAVNWNPHVALLQLLGDLERTFLADRQVDIFGCTVPIDDIRCHKEDVVKPTWLRPPSPLPSIKVSLDFECLQGLLSHSSVNEVEIWFLSSTALEENVTLRFAGIHAAFTMRLEVEGPQIGPLKLPTFRDEELVSLRNLSLSMVLPIQGQCDQSENLTFHVDPVQVLDFELDLDRLHPLEEALGGVLNRLCGSSPILGEQCEDVLAAADASTTDAMSHELLHRVPSLLAANLGSVIQTAMQRHRIPCQQVTGSNAGWTKLAIFGVTSVLACGFLCRRLRSTPSGGAEGRRPQAQEGEGMFTVEEVSGHVPRAPFDELESGALVTGSDNVGRYRPLSSIE